MIGQFERREKPIDPVEKPRDTGGPEKPDTDTSRDKLLKRMRKVDPKQSERYRQRTGE